MQAPSNRAASCWAGFEFRLYPLGIRLHITGKTSACSGCSTGGRGGWSDRWEHISIWLLWLPTAITSVLGACSVWRGYSRALFYVCETAVIHIELGVFLMTASGHEIYQAGLTFSSPYLQALHNPRKQG
ncbi:hypothetical protein V8F20_010911 [Naviculisporaceae sp. PSN 640]